MDWLPSLVLIVGLLFVLLLLRFPVAFCFLFLNMVFAFFLWKGGAGLNQVVLSFYSSIGNFIMSPLPMFVLLGEVLFISQIATGAISTIDKLLGRLPGRLGLVATVSGALFASVTGSSIGSTAMLGTMLTPDMESRGYKKPMSLGPVMGAGGLAMIIPPSSMAVLIGALAKVSIGHILIAGVLPGIFLAFLYAGYIIGRCMLQPSIAPAYVPAKTPLSEKLMSIVRNVLPLGIIIFAIIGCIFMGIATPTESAAMGSIAAFLMAAAYGRLKWNLVKQATIGTVRISVMIFMIIGGALAFSQILASTGATQGMIKYMTSLNLSPFLLIGIMMIIVLILGSFMDSVAIMMIVIPIFMPIIMAIGYDSLLFCLLLLINIETGFLTPPFGTVLFTMKGIAPPDTTTGDIYKAAAPFVACNVVAILVIMFIPQIALWLPNIMNN